jgi:acetoin utilization deacetylase AcuC-like enzyme
VVFATQPDAVFYLAGADPYEGDRLGRLQLSIGGLRRRDEMVMHRCRRAGAPFIVTMSGGYAHDVAAIVTIHANTIAAAAQSQVAAQAGPPDCRQAVD